MSVALSTYILPCLIKLKLIVSVNIKLSSFNYCFHLNCLCVATWLPLGSMLNTVTAKLGHWWVLMRGCGQDYVLVNYRSKFNNLKLEVSSIFEVASRTFSYSFNLLKLSQFWNHAYEKAGPNILNCHPLSAGTDCLAIWPSNCTSISNTKINIKNLFVKWLVTR